MLTDGFARRTSVFTLQWHLTNACAHHCTHCYDRAPRATLSLDGARRVLADFLDFCWRQSVAGRISLSGGDPFRYPHFWELYSAIAEAGVPVAILGNPIDHQTLARLLTVQRPLYFQVSLEGLSQHNDCVRGAGHYARTLAFLDDAARQGLVTHVMLTATAANLDQILPLAHELRGRTLRLTFNRVAQVGEAAGVAAPGAEEYAAFLDRYLRLRRDWPLLGLKDNLFNVALRRMRRPLFGGCTGHGCGAAFDFLALLPDGEVHACRKFPSRVGHVGDERLGAIYASAEASRYRAGSRACRACRLRARCGGCPAVTYGRGLDPLLDRDPDCVLASGEDIERNIWALPLSRHQGVVYNASRDG